MDAFGVRIEMLSRFRSRKEQKDTLDKLAKGDLDIVIGTHRLIQPMSTSRTWPSHHR